MQRVSSDFRLNPHCHTLGLDGVFAEQPDGELRFHALPFLTNTDVADVLQIAPPISQDRIRLVDDDLVRLTLKRPFSDGTFAIDMDPLSLVARLAASVPPPRFNTVRYAGVLAANSKWRSRVSASRRIRPMLAPSRGPPWFKSRVIRRKLGEPQQAELFDAH